MKAAIAAIKQRNEQAAAEKAARDAELENEQQKWAELQSELDAFSPKDRAAAEEYAKQLAEQRAAAIARAKDRPQPSRVPAPIEPVRASGYIPSPHKKTPPLPEKVVRGGGPLPRPRMKAARWDYWRNFYRAPLWQYVALSLGKEPESWIGNEVDIGPVAGSWLPIEFQERLKVCLANLHGDGKIRPQGPRYMGPSCVVLLSEVAGFLTQAGFDVPEEMRDLAPALPQSQAPQVAPVAPATPAAALEQSAAPAGEARVVTHSTKDERRDDLWADIKRAQDQCNDQWDVAEVWPAMLRDAEEEKGSLLGLDGQRIKHRGGFLTRKALGERLKGRKEKLAKAR